jgi:uncharacterized protein with FMN-binding domain
MRRIAFWFLSTLSVVVLLFGYDGSTSADLSASPPALASGNGAVTANPPSTGSDSADSGGTVADTPSDGSPASGTTTVTGDAASTRWGPVQLELTISSGKITGVTVLQQPSGNNKDIEINQYALPILIEETTSSQSANIDMVSGATVTSSGYVQSLQSAIDKAGL